MFLFGSLTSLFPYLATIVAMCLCMLVGTPLKTKSIDFNQANSISYTQKSERVSQVNDSKDARQATYVENVEEYSPSDKPTEQTLRPHYKSSHYSYAHTYSNSNKAPPFLV